MTNAKKDWLEALRECRDALEPLDDKERSKTLAAFWSVYPAPGAELLDGMQVYRVPPSIRSFKPTIDP